jgi:hypothetical protein
VVRKYVIKKFEDNLNIYTLKSTMDRTMEAGILAAMGFKESLIQKAMAEAAQRTDRITHLQGIIEILVNMTAPNNAASNAGSAARGSLAATFPVSPASSRQLIAAVGGGAVMSNSRTHGLSRVETEETGQVDIVTATLFKQRHIFGFAIEAREQVEARKLR